MVRTKFNKYFLNWNKCILKMHLILKKKKSMKNALRLGGIKLTWQYNRGSQLNSELPLWSQKLYTPTRRLIHSILVTYCWIIISTFKTNNSHLLSFMVLWFVWTYWVDLLLHEALTGAAVTWQFHWNIQGD